MAGKNVFAAGGKSLSTCWMGATNYQWGVFHPPLIEVSLNLFIALFIPFNGE